MSSFLKLAFIRNASDILSYVNILIIPIFECDNIHESDKLKLTSAHSPHSGSALEY